MTIQVTTNSPVAAPAAGAGETTESNKSVLADQAGQKDAASPDGAEAEAKETPSEEKEPKEKEPEGADNDADDDEEADEAAAKSDDAVGEDGKPKKKSGSQRRKERAERAEAEVRRLQKLVEELAFKNAGEASKKAPEPEAKKEAPADKPKPDDFDSHEDYVEALTDWKLDQRDKARKAEEEKAKLETEQKSILQTHQERMDAFAATMPDFVETIQDMVAEGIRLSVAVDELIVSSEHGPALLYQLAKNPKELARINALGPLAAAREIGRMEAKLGGKEAAEEAKPKPEAKKTTQAPKPVTPIGGKSAPVEKSLYDPTLSQAEYERIRREQLKRKTASW